MRVLQGAIGIATRENRLMMQACLPIGIMLFIFTQNRPNFCLESPKRVALFIPPQFRAKRIQPGMSQICVVGRPDERATARPADQAGASAAGAFIGGPSSVSPACSKLQVCDYPDGANRPASPMDSTQTITSTLRSMCHKICIDNVQIGNPVTAPLKRYLSSGGASVFIVV